MATYDLSITPNTMSMHLRGNTGLYPSPLIASAQTLDRGGLKWAAILNYTALHHDKRGEMLGFLASLNAQVNRFRISVQDNPKRGSYGGTPLVNGGSQTGYSLDIDGCSSSVTNWIRAGDYFSVVVNGEHELKMCTADANSSGGGAVTISFVPKLRASPLNNAIVWVEDGVLGVPKGVFALENPNIGWSSVPFQSGSHLSQVTINAVEDVFATQ